MLRAGHVRPLPRHNGKRQLRRGQDPSLQIGVHGCFVGNGLDRSGDVCRLLHGKTLLRRRGRACPARSLPASTCLRFMLRAGHARPLPRHNGKRQLRRGQDPSLQIGVHGCFVGNGLDRSGDVCRLLHGKTLLRRRGRACPARSLPASTCFPVYVAGRTCPAPTGI